MTDEEVVKDYWKWEKEMKSKITQAHTDGYNRGYAKRKEEIKTLGERCNQLLKDKGDLTDKNKQLELIILGNQEEIENQAVAYETLKLHDQEEIGMLKSRVAELEQEVEILRNLGLENINKYEQWHLTDRRTIGGLEKENAELKTDKQYWEQKSNRLATEWGETLDQLAQAKGIIKGLLDLPDLIEDRTSEHIELIGKAEQFLWGKE